MPTPIGADDLYRFRWIDHVRLSQDGERIAYQLTWADAESRQNRSRVVVRRILDQEPVDATAGPRRDHSPEWSPDGRHIAFMSKRGPTDQVFVLDVASGGDARPVSSVAEGASGASWSPDGSRIAFIGIVVGDPDGVVDDPRPPDNKEQVRRSPVARLVRRLDYKHDGQGYTDGRNHHLFVVPVAGGEATQLTSGAWDVTGFDWAPDGARLVVAGNAEPESDLRRELNLYVVDLAGNREKLVAGFYLSSPAWSPRGDLIAFVAPKGMEAGLIERVWVVPASGGEARCVTAGLDQSVGDSLITDMRGGHDLRLRWSKDGGRLYFLASGPGVAGAYSSDLEGNLSPEAVGPRRIYDFDVASGVFAFCASDPSNPGELHVVMRGAEARLTDLNPWLRERYLAAPERHQFTAPDGWLIEGWLLKPPDFDPGRRYPLVLEVHGGPHGQYGWAFFHELQMLAGMGYLVLYTNPRGSDGYGERFRREVVRDWGGKDYLDLMSALDQLIERTRSVDTSRMGIGGGSYGGYMTNWVIGQTERFAAAVSMRSISNLVSEYAQHDIVIWGALELGPAPWPDLDELWRRSPIRYVKNIRTPLLLTCGEMDLRCAISQSEELFGAMRLLGKTVELIRFPDETHDLSRSGRPDRRVERLRRIAGWYERFLGTASSEPVRETFQEADTMVLAIRDLQALALIQEAEPRAPVLEVEEAPAQTVDAEPDPESIELAPQVDEPAPAADEVPHEPQPVAAELVGEEPWTASTQILSTYEMVPVLAPEPEAEPEPEGPPLMSEALVIEPEALEPASISPAAEHDLSPPPQPSPLRGEDVPVIEPSADATQPPAPMPGPADAAPEAASSPDATDRVAETILAWPQRTEAALPNNGSPSSAREASEEATSIIPAWQPSNATPVGKGTVSLVAVPQEDIASGAGYPAKLTFESGPFAGRVVALPNTTVTFGRAPDNDLVVGDPATSGRHGHIEVRAGAFWISDLGSTNGTQVNGEPIIEQQLSPGDLIAIGANLIRFTLEG